jgi:hypothetical protein
MKVQYTVNSKDDVKLFMLCFVSFVEELIDLKDYTVHVVAPTSLHQMIKNSIKGQAEHLVTVSTERQADAKAMSLNMLFLFGAFSAYLGGNARAINITSVDSDCKEFEAMLKEMEETSVIPRKVLVFEQDEMLAMAMHCSLQMIMSVYQKIDSRMA